MSRLIFIKIKFHSVVLALFVCMELTWRNGSVMGCRATTQGSNPGGNGVKIELDVHRKGQ